MAKLAQQGASGAHRGAIGHEVRSRDHRSTAIAVALVTLLVARAVVSFVPSMALWGLNVQRFLDPWWAWAPWVLAAAALTPPVARRLAPLAEAAGRAIQTRTALGGLVAAVIAAALVFALPDRLYFVGDFLIRLGGLRDGQDPTVLSPQAFPLDVWLHYSLPRWVQSAGWTDVHTAVRVIGAVGAALLGAAAIFLARSMRVGPAATTAAAAMVLFGGYLCLYTGESKAFAEICVVVVAFAACALAVADASRAASGSAAVGVPLLGAGLCVSIGVLFHRFALGLVPALLLTWVIGFRALRRARGGPGAAALFAVTIPITVLCVLAPRLWRTIVTYDLGANFATAETRAGGGMLAAAFEPTRLLDVLNLVLFLAPALLVAVIAAIAGRRAAEPDAAIRQLRRDQGWIAASIAIPFAFVFLAARPPQGLVRDWDSFATAGVALAVWSAWRIAVALDGSRRGWLAVAVIAAVATPAVQWLVHYADEARGFARLEALMLEPPGRPAVDRARTWDFLGWRNFREARYEDSARAFEQAVAAAPSARNHTHWAMAETMNGRHDRALDIYLRAAERDSNLTIAWFGVGVSGINCGNRAAVEHAVLHLRRLAPDNDKTREIVGWLESEGAAPR